MPHTHSSAKRLRQTKTRTARNRLWKGRVKTLLKEARKSIAAKNTSAQEEVMKALATIDRSVSKGVLHRNAGARKKSRLMRYLQKHLVST